MNDLNSSYWNGRYLNDNFAWDVGYCSTPLQQYIDQLNNKDLKILIPGAGNSYEAEYLHVQGFKYVTVLDFAAAALQNLKQRVPDFPLSNLIEQNFFEHTGQYDLIIEQTFFCALSPELRKDYIKQMHALVKPGGKLVGVMFNAPMNANEPPFGGTIEEYRNLFEGLFTIKVLEPCYNSIKPRDGKEAFVVLERK